MENQAIGELLRSRHIRPTLQRIAVYRFLYENRVHASVDTVYEAVSKEYPAFSRTTVYNTIKTLVASGLVRAVNIEGEYVRYDANPQDHGHFKCTGCGKIFDFPASRREKPPAELDGFEIRIKDTYFYGLCRECAKRAATDGESAS